jgi:hypothetical protein
MLDHGQTTSAPPGTFYLMLNPWSCSSLELCTEVCGSSTDRRRGRRAVRATFILVSSIMLHALMSRCTTPTPSLPPLMQVTTAQS